MDFSRSSVLIFSSWEPSQICIVRTFFLRISNSYSLELKDSWRISWRLPVLALYYDIYWIRASFFWTSSSNISNLCYYSCMWSFRPSISWQRRPSFISLYSNYLLASSSFSCRPRYASWICLAISMTWNNLLLLSAFLSIMFCRVVETEALGLFGLMPGLIPLDGVYCFYWAAFLNF